MNRAAFRLLIAGVLLCAASAAVSAEPLEIQPGYEVSAAPEPIQRVSAQRGSMGGGFIEFLFGDGPAQGPTYERQPQPIY